jgi:hypothetical protein
MCLRDLQAALICRTWQLWGAHKTILVPLIFSMLLKLPTKLLFSDTESIGKMENKAWYCKIIHSL